MLTVVLAMPCIMYVAFTSVAFSATLTFLPVFLTVP